MSFKIYDFLCEDGHKFDKLVYSDEVESTCECGKIAKKVPSAPQLSVKMGIDLNSAQSNRWAKMHEQEAKRQNAKIDPSE